MCGFIVQSGPRRPEFDEALVRLQHRGIRSTVAESKGGTMGHVRLPIVGLGAENDQPVRREGNGGWLIAFVGEILDFRDSDPRADCDLQVVTRRWMQRGPSGLTNRDGFWSVAALSDAGNLHVVCDYLGQKPAYYRVDVRAVASEPHALAALGPTTPDEVYLSAVIKWGYCPEIERTPYREIKHVLPGEYVAISKHGEVSREIVDPLVGIAAGEEDLKHEIEMSVRRRVLSADVPVACLLSGGLDSSIAYTLARRHGVVCPYYVREGAEEDAEELEAVQRVAAGAHVHTETWDAVDPLEALRVMQEPIDLGSLLPQVALSRVVKETVCLTGDGADEMFGGYDRAQRYDSQHSDVFHELPAWHLPRLDRAMMRHCVEVRSPFLARRVAQIALGLPWSVRQDKMALRSVFRQDLPPGIADRPKRPLRTREVESDREAVSRRMVDQFRRMTWPDDKSPAREGPLEELLTDHSYAPSA